jgi:transcriptional regulator of acetoin/glycerol metabolism
MVARTEISPFRLGIRGHGLVSADELMSLLEAPAFRAMADLLPDPLIAVDTHENVTFLNSAMERLSGISATAAERLPFGRFLRRAGWSLEETSGNRTDGRARLFLAKEQSTLPVLRRILPAHEGAEGYTVYIIRPGEAPDAPPRSPEQANDTSALLFPDSIEEQIRRAARAYRRGVRVLLLGESGVGKTAIARHIHNLATARGAPFVHVNCSSIPETLFESEMFGYERGAFTGALQAGKRGYIESAKGGTLFLDEIGEIPLVSQAKLLKFLEDSTIQPVGSAVSKHIMTTVITATNRDLRSMIAQGTFRGDLFYRVATFPVSLPPLRERPDKDRLLDAILAKVNAGRRPKLSLSKSCRAVLLTARFPGNLRELLGIIEYLDIVADNVATPEHLAEALVSSQSSTPHADLPTDGTLKEMTASFEDQVIRDAVARHGSKREAAKQLGIDGATLIRKLRRPVS